MPLPWMDREAELKRLGRVLSAREPAMAVVYGRRRCGKSRLVLEALKDRRAVYFVGDEREGTLQRQALAGAMEHIVPGFASVNYPTWEALLLRWGKEAPRGAALALDEFPYLATSGPELPGLLQKLVDDPTRWSSHLILCGSSQRMMHGLVLDESAPLYGRAREILKVEPLRPGWLKTAFPRYRARELLEAHAVWGGVPRYWELAAGFGSVQESVRELVLDPMGVLFEEPTRLLMDEMQEVVQASSVLSLIGAGCHRLSEIAGRLQKPATALSGPLRRLVDMGFVRRDVPFGASERDNKRSHRIGRSWRLVSSTWSRKKSKPRCQSSSVTFGKRSRARAFRPSSSPTIAGGRPRLGGAQARTNSRSRSTSLPNRRTARLCSWPKRNFTLRHGTGQS